MHYVEIKAPEPFRRLIHCVWFLNGSSRDYQPQPVVPDGRIELLVHAGDPFSQVESGKPPVRQAAVLVAGQLTGPLHLSPGTAINVVGIRLNPLVAHALLGIPLHELTDQILPLHAVHRRLADQLQDVTLRSQSQSVRARGISELIGRFLRHEPAPRMIEALDSLAAPGPNTLRRTLERLEVSRRTLERRFQEEVGLTPKVHARVVRFRRAFALFSRNLPVPWSRIAAEAGYYDQAHLIRDFRRFAGLPPRAFFKTDASLARAFLSGETAPRTDSSQRASQDTRVIA